MGAPYDAASRHPGARYGPDGIREQSLHYAFRGQQKSCVDINQWKIINKPEQLKDCGDIEYDISMSQKEYYDLAENCISLIKEKGGIPFVLGGDHSITYPVVKAVNKGEKITIVQFDAHLDCNLVEDNQERILHSNFISHVRQLPNVEEVYQCGIRQFQAIEEKVISSIKNKPIISDWFLNELTEEKFSTYLPSDRKLYVTFDIDVLSSQYAPSTGYPSLFGVEPTKLLQVLGWLIQHNTLVGMDMMEVAGKPTKYDSTNQMACFFLCHVLSFLQKK